MLLSYEHYRQLIDEEPSLAELLSRTEEVGDIDFEIPETDHIAQPAVFD